MHGGYGYSSEYLPEAWLRDQKLIITIHEGRAVFRASTCSAAVAGGGEALKALLDEIVPRRRRGRSRRGRAILG
ncbi:MAG: hypothetical protein U0359_09490 [Byssovorax sp.]